MAWLIPFSGLTDEQIRAVQASTQTHRFVVGAPGSGKTLVLVHRASLLARQMKTPPERFRILVFTNVLKDYIRAGCRELGIPDSSISTYDHWCREHYERHIGGRLPWNAAIKSYDFPAIRKAANQSALARKERLFDFVLVDEGQDLDPESFEVLRTIAGHVTVCADYKQQIYDNGATEEDIATRLGLPQSNVCLLSAFRCSPYIVPLAASFIDDPMERRYFFEQTRNAPGERETPVFYVAPNFDAEKERLAQVVRTRQLAGDRIAILLPQKRQVFGFAQGMRDNGIEVETQSSRPSQPGLDFTTARPKLVTYHSAKGLTFDTVLLPRLVTNSFSRLTEDRLCRLLFVGITRAVKWVYMSSVEGEGLGLLDRLNPLAEARTLEIQSGQTTAASTAKAQVPQTAPNLDDLF